MRNLRSQKLLNPAEPISDAEAKRAAEEQGGILALSGMTIGHGPEHPSTLNQTSVQQSVKGEIER